MEKYRYVSWRNIGKYHGDINSNTIEIYRQIPWKTKHRQILWRNIAYRSEEILKGETKEYSEEIN